MRRSLARGSAVLVALVTVGIALLIPAANSLDRARATAPSVVLVVFDDLDLELARQMPILQRLERSGLNFPNAFVTAPLCCPSRVSILTGQYPHNHGILSNRGELGGHARFVESGGEERTMAMWLQSVGYRTALVGKYLNRYGEDTDPRHVPPGWNEWIALTGHRKDYKGYLLNVHGTLIRPERSLTAEIEAHTQDLLETLAPPFFILVTPFEPHLPPMTVKPSPAEAAAVRGELARRGDALLGLIAAALPPETYLIVTSDNGFHLHPEPAKSQPYDTDTRVPLFIVGPPAGTDERLALNIDIAPTIAELAGAAAPDVDGRSLLQPVDREAFLVELRDFTALHTRDSLYVEWRDGRRESFGPATEETMRRRLAEMKTCGGATC
jgi:N-acetylglucosamine-6-sulfatase